MIIDNWSIINYYDQIRTISDQWSVLTSHCSDSDSDRWPLITHMMSLSLNCVASAKEAQWRIVQKCCYARKLRQFQLWYTVYGIWYTVYGVRCTVYGTVYMRQVKSFMHLCCISKVNEGLTDLPWLSKPNLQESSPELGKTVGGGLQTKANHGPIWRSQRRSPQTVSDPLSWH